MAVSSYAAPVVEPAKRPQSRVVAPDSSVRKVAILGFGTVGRSVAEILCSKAFPQLRLTHIFNRHVVRKFQPWVPADVCWTENLEDVLLSDVDLVVEAAGGLRPAGDWIRRALLAGKSVVTANKHLIANEGRELEELARTCGRSLEFGASVGGGVPVLSAVAHGLAGERLVQLKGVLNGTCNYILSGMELRGLKFDEALAQAQRLGYAEADPSDDLNGVDASCKLAILARVGMGITPNPQQICARTILGVAPEDFRAARKLGCTIRQVSIAERNGEGLRAAVLPALVPLSSALGHTRENQNALVTTGAWGGESVFAGLGAGGRPTAVAVVSDLLSIAGQGTETRLPGRKSEPCSHVSSDFTFPFYVRLKLTDQSKAEAVLRTVADPGLVVDKLLRKSQSGKSKVSLIVSLRPCAMHAVENALQIMQQRELIRGPATWFPIL